MLFDNSLNDKPFRIDIRVENGYEEGCKRGAKISGGVFLTPFTIFSPGSREKLWLSWPELVKKENNAGLVALCL